MTQPHLAGVRVFVTHSHQDNDFTTRLVSDLTDAGAQVWVDIASIVAGDFVKRINEGLNAADWVIFVVTPASLQSRSVEMEINAALDMLRQNLLNGIIPIIAAPVHHHDIQPLFRSLHRYDATVDYKNAVAGLIRALSMPVADAPSMEPPAAKIYPAPVVSPHRHVSTVLPPRSDFHNLTPLQPEAAATVEPEPSSLQQGGPTESPPDAASQSAEKLPSWLHRLFSSDKNEPH